MNRRSFLARIPAITAPLIAGCSGSGAGVDGTPTATESQTPTESPTPTATETATSSPTPTPEAVSAQQKYPDYTWSKLAEASSTATTTITMANTAFDPLITAVKPGTTVEITNSDSFSHTITIPKLRIDTSISGGGSTSFTVEKTGTFDFVCRLHPPGMLGRLVVTEELPTPTPTPTATATPTTTSTATTADKTISIAGSAFQPLRADVETEATLKWVNNDGYAHTVTDAQFHDKAASWSFDERLSAGESVTHTFDEAGVYEYTCTIHGKTTMCGAVLVGDATLEKDLPCEGGGISY